MNLINRAPGVRILIISVKAITTRGTNKIRTLGDQHEGTNYIFTPGCDTTKGTNFIRTPW